MVRLGGPSAVLLGLLLLSPPGVVSAAVQPGTTAQGFDCATQARAYPERWQAEGATFLGRVLSVRKLADEFRVVRLSVARTFAGDIRDRVTVRTVCVETRFRVGERYLISSSRFDPNVGRIDTIRFVNAASVAWRVADDGTIRLLDFGSGLGTPTAPYLTRPDTVYEAAHAVALGIKAGGVCTGQARWRMEVDRIHGGLEVVVALDTRPDRDWTVDLFHDYGRILHQERRSLDGVTLVRHVEDLIGPDRIGLVARQADGQLCKGSITWPAVPMAPTVKWGPMAVVHDPAVDGMDARIGPGRLVIGTDCARVMGSSGTGTTLVWRDGQTRWDADGRSIVFRDLDGTRLVLRDGDRVFLGGYSPPPTDASNPPLAPWVVRPNPDCPARQWAVHEVRRADRRPAGKLSVMRTRP